MNFGINILIPFFNLVINFVFDNDFWFTINQGRYVIENGFPIKAINSIHDIDFLYQRWVHGICGYDLDKRQHIFILSSILQRHDSREID